MVENFSYYFLITQAVKVKKGQAVFIQFCSTMEMSTIRLSCYFKF